MLRRTSILILLLPALAAFPQDPKAAGQIYEAWPFDAAEAARRQAETAKLIDAADPLTIPLSKEPAVALTFRLIPAGKFQLGLLGEQGRFALRTGEHEDVTEFLGEAGPKLRVGQRLIGLA